MVDGVSIVLHCIALYFISLHCIALHCIVLYCIVLYRDLLIVLPMREPSIFRGIAVSLLRRVIGSRYKTNCDFETAIPHYIDGGIYFFPLAVNIMWYCRLKIAISL